MIDIKNQLQDIKTSITVEQASREDTGERSQALQDYTALCEELAQLDKELQSYGDADPAKHEESKRAVILAKEAALRWTGSVAILTTASC